MPKLSEEQKVPVCVGCGEEKSPIHFLPGKDLYLCKDCCLIILKTFEEHEKETISAYENDEVKHD